MPSSRGIRRPNASFGFTLIELLVVIGIIAILVGILLPVVSMMTKKSRQTDTAAEINKLAIAIQNYYQDFKAYPGPVPDTAPIYGYTGQKQLTTAIPPVSPQSIPPSQAIVSLSSSENLILGLLGGLFNNAGTVQFNATLIGKGPQSLNALSPQQNSPYVDVNINTELTPDPNYGYNSWTTGQQGYTSPPLPALVVPEFLDHFSNPRPIIYLRASNGARGSIADGWTDSSINPIVPSSGTPPSQYWSQEMAPYWYGATAPNTNVAAPGTVFPTQGDQVNNGQSLYPTAAASGGAVMFFANPSIVGTARAQDQFMLISAGSDGIYGTSDDVVYPPQ